MQQGEHESTLTRIRQDFERQSREFKKLKEENENFREVTEKKLHEKEQ